MGMPRLDAELWTADMVRAFPDDSNRYEVIDGELVVAPSPKWSHQRVVGALHLILAPWTAAQGVGDTMLSPADLGLEPGGLVQPDLFVVRPNDDGSRPRDWQEVTRLLLAVEVLSPSTVRDDRGRKRKLFARVGVPEYWIADGERRVIERWRPGDELPELCNRSLTWRPAGVADPLDIDVPKLFRDALGT